MATDESLLLGEFARTLDDRFRLSLPAELAEQLTGPGTSEKECLIAKERPGCLSLWNLNQWRKKLDEGVALVQSKIAAGKLDGRLAEVQSLGRLLSTRHRQLPLAGRGRLVIPEGFREFLGVEAGGNVMLVGAAVCVEIWNPDSWTTAIGDQMPDFRQLFDQLSS
ncbi:MAG: division/cell wall cluster transcriptional repressor MraZ [Aeoliella sp.]